MTQEPEGLGDILHRALREKGLVQDHNYYEPDAHEDSLYPNISRDMLEKLVWVMTNDNRPSRRIQRGFARAGIVFGSLPVIGGLGTLANYVLQGWAFTAHDFAVSTLVFGGTAVILYGLFAAIGWILSGFFK